METYLVLNSDEEVEYRITRDTIKGNLVTAIYISHSAIWSEEIRGEFQNSILDDGNSIIFNNIKRKMDYSDFVILRILIDFNAYMDKHLANEYRVVNGKAIIRI